MPPPSPTLVGPAELAAADAERAAAPLGISFTQARSTPECAVLVELFDDIWDTGNAHSVVDLATVVAMSANDNLVCLVRRAGVPVAGAVGFFGAPGRPFHSHVVGVSRQAALRGIGYAVKLHQRAWCLARGVETMTWTYDPLVARNAYFNVAKLGARATSYHRDHYGLMRDSLNRGQSSDRVLARWDLTSSLPAPAPRPGPEGHVALAGPDGLPGEWAPPPPGARRVLVAVPDDVEALRRDDPAAATRWRAATRHALTELLEHGWRVTGFERGAGYVLTPDPEPAP